MKFLKPILFAFILITWFTGIPNPVNAQQSKSPFLSEIQAFKRQDSIQPPPENGILFIGSSSFRMWNDLEKVFKKYNVINRGFGGSNLLDAQFYADRIIFPYNPRQIIIYSGENDIASDTVNSSQVLRRFIDLFEMIRAKLPLVPVAFVSIKPSPSREKFRPLMEQSNQLIKTYLQKHQFTHYIDVFSLMLNSEGKPKADIFIEDNLHMNQKGYQIWHKAIEPHLLQK